MIKFFLYISISLLVFNSSFAKNIDIQEDIKIGFVCELEKKILKNSEYNYKTFLAKDLDDQNLDKFEIDAKQPEKLLINGLSLFLSQTAKFEVKVVNKDIVLFKALNKTMSLLTTFTSNFAVCERNNDNPLIKSFSGCFASISNLSKF